ncbi:MAG: PssD/Cps14F family polysaccharide biosynthesis glycosyltransferase [Actinomycetota bacterium]
MARPARQLDPLDQPPLPGPDDGPKRVLFVSSSGGHLSQLLQLRAWWGHHDRQWVTFDLPDARSKLEGEILIPAHHPTTRSVKNLLRNLPLAVSVVRRFRPDVIVSNGAGVAVPFFLVARLLRIPTVYLEVYDRIDSKTLSGKLCAPLASLFLVQWPEQQSLYRNSVLVGPLY